MRYYPIFLNIRQKNCLVVGGGRVGTRKVKTLVECGAIVTVVSQDFTAELLDLAASGKVSLKKRSYSKKDMKNIFLVIGATSDEALNRRIYRDAEKMGVISNIADRPEICRFILPSIVHRGDLVIASSTTGKSPAFAKKLKNELESAYGEEYALFLMLMGRIRERLLAEDHEHEAHKEIFTELVEAGIPRMIRKGKKEKIEETLREILGGRYHPDDLQGILP